MHTLSQHSRLSTANHLVTCHGHILATILQCGNESLSCALCCDLYIEAHFVTLTKHTVKVVFFLSFLFLVTNLSAIVSTQLLGNHTISLLNLKETHHALCKSPEQRWFAKKKMQVLDIGDGVWQKTWKCQIATTEKILYIRIECIHHISNHIWCGCSGEGSYGCEMLHGHYKCMW